MERWNWCRGGTRGDGFSARSSPGQLSLGWRKGVVLQVWKIVNGRQTVDRKWFLSLPAQNLGFSEKAGRGRFSVLGYKLLVEPPCNSIFWVLEAWLSSAMVGQDAWEKGLGRC